MLFPESSIQWGRAKEEAYSALLELKLGKSKSALARYKAACKYADKDYSPNTLLMLQTVYAQLQDLPGLEPQEPPGILSRQNNDNEKEEIQSEIIRLDFLFSIYYHKMTVFKTCNEAEAGV